MQLASALGALGECAYAAGVALAVYAGATIDEIDLEGAQNLLVEINRAVAAGKITQLSVSQAVATEIAIAVAEKDYSRARDGAGCDPLFRLHSSGWAVGELDFVRLVPVNDRQLQVLHFDYDVSNFRDATTIADLPLAAASHPSHVVVFHQAANRNPLIVDTMTARFLGLVDERTTVDEILRQLDRDDSISTSIDWAQWVENLFRRGFIGLRHVDFNVPECSNSPIVSIPHRNTRDHR